jgi:hypothetical protein
MKAQCIHCLVSILNLIKGIFMKAKRIVKVGECLNLSAKYKLTYHIGIDDQDSIMIRVAENEGGGYFSPEWVKLETILAKLDSAKKPLTSFSLHGIFEGKSANTPGFIFAVLYAEGIVERDIENPRVYVSTDPKPVIESIEALIKGGTDIKVDQLPDGAKTTPSKTAHTKKQNSSKS